MSGFDFQRSDENVVGNNSQTMDIGDLQHNIDSLNVLVDNLTTSAYNPLLRDQLFAKDPDAVAPIDSIPTDRTRKVYKKLLLDSLQRLDARTLDKIYQGALRSARSSRNAFSFDETTSKEAINQLYRSKNEWHRKLTLPISILIFFLIGAPLGAIIRKGGLGMPIVISVIFFVIYYVMSIPGEKMAKEGTLETIYGMWMPIALLTPVAIFLVRKATNDSSLLDMDWYDVRIRRMRKAISKRIPNWMKRKNKVNK
jgi:lipopolysaccharide export system permease protein